MLLFSSFLGFFFGLCQQPYAKVAKGSCPLNKCRRFHLRVFCRRWSCFGVGILTTSVKITKFQEKGTLLPFVLLSNGVGQSGLSALLDRKINTKNATKESPKKISSLIWGRLNTKPKMVTKISVFFPTLLNRGIGPSPFFLIPSLARSQILWWCPKRRTAKGKHNRTGVRTNGNEFGKGWVSLRPLSFYFPYGNWAEV